MVNRFRVNKLARGESAWVASAVARRVELDGELHVPPGIGAGAAVLAFGRELLEQPGIDAYEYQWSTPGGRKFAADALLPRAEAALRTELQRLVDEAKRSAAARRTNDPQPPGSSSA